MGSAGLRPVPKTVTLTYGLDGAAVAVRYLERCRDKERQLPRGPGAFRLTEPGQGEADGERDSQGKKGRSPRSQQSPSQSTF